MYILHLDRTSLLAYLPQNGVVAEIGVSEGDFTQDILSTAAPRHLRLIDPWEFQGKADYLADPNNVPQDEGDARVAAVAARFADRIGTGAVAVERAYSLDAARCAADRSFDWIYIDAMHTYDAVIADLRAWAPKVKEDGLILGHDYANHPLARKMSFGVVEAVNDFVEESGYAFLFLTLESYPTYVLAKDAAAPTVGAFVTRTLHGAPTAIEIADPARRAYTQRMAKFSDGTQKLFFRFG